MTYLFFRDLDSDGNLKDGISYHAAGLVDKQFGENLSSGKDLFVIFINPFSGVVEREWRSIKDVCLFEVKEWEYRTLKNTLESIK